MDDGHATSESPEHLPELQADVSAAEDEQVFVQFGQPHDAGIIEVVDRTESFHLRDVRPSAGINEDALALQNFFTNAHLMRPDEPSVPAVKAQRFSVIDLAFES